MQIDKENYEEGEIHCPAKGCGAAIKMANSCSIVTCRGNAHGNKFYYFCAHCKAECPDGEARCSDCPWRNDKQTRERVRQKREEWLACNTVDNPCMLD